MAKAIPDAIIDAMLAAAEGDRLFVCSAEPSNYTEASSTYMLAAANVNVANDYTKAAGSTGRKSTLKAFNGISISNTGTATHVAIGNSSGSTLLRVTTCSAKGLTQGDTVDIGSHAHEIGAPT